MNGFRGLVCLRWWCGIERTSLRLEPQCLFPPCIIPGTKTAVTAVRVATTYICWSKDREPPKLAMHDCAHCEAGICVRVCELRGWLHVWSIPRMPALLRLHLSMMMHARHTHRMCLIRLLGLTSDTPSNGSLF